MCINQLTFALLETLPTANNDDDNDNNNDSK